MNVPNSGSKEFYINNQFYYLYLTSRWHLKSFEQNFLSGMFTHCKEVKQRDQ